MRNKQNQSANHTRGQAKVVIGARNSRQMYSGKAISNKYVSSFVTKGKRNESLFFKL